MQSLSVNDCDIPGVNVIKYLGAYLDENLTLKTHIRNKKKSRIAMANYHRIKNIRKYVTVDACKQVVHGLIICNIDYCNSLFYDLPETDIKNYNVCRV